MGALFLLQAAKYLVQVLSVCVLKYEGVSKWSVSVTPPSHRYAILRGFAQRNATPGKKKKFPFLLLFYKNLKTTSAKPGKNPSDPTSTTNQALPEGSIVPRKLVLRGLLPPNVEFYLQ